MHRPIVLNPVTFGMFLGLEDTIESPQSLITGACAIALQCYPDVDISGVAKKLDEIAHGIMNRVKGTQPQAMLAHLHECLFEEFGFRGNLDHYHDPLNSSLPHILNSKTGLPITLSLVYKAVAERCGIPVHGIPLPGHFCVGVEDHNSIMIIDPFHKGQILNKTEAQKRMRDTYGPGIEWNDNLLLPISNRHWLTRIMQNLLHTYSDQENFTQVAAILEIEMMLWPDQTHLKRDLALVLARIGYDDDAAQLLQQYLNDNPSDPQRGELEERLNTLLS